MKHLSVYIVLTLIVILTAIPTINAQALIICHGAFAEDGTWWQKGGDFFTAIEYSKKDFEKFYNTTLEISSLKWKQPFCGLFDCEKIRAAYALINDIKFLKAKGHEKVHVFAHSYGGHVAFLAARLMTDATTLHSGFFNPLDMTKSATSYDPETNTQRSNFIKLYQETVTNLQQELQHNTTKDIPTIPTPLTTITPPEKATSPFLIDVLYTAGTPHNFVEFFPVTDAGGIGYLLNLYSEEDIVQKMIGQQRIPDPLPTRCVNLTVSLKRIKNQNIDIHDPGHAQMHQPTIGRWILSIPFILSARKIMGFDDFSFENNGHLIFDDTTTYSATHPPIYYPCNPIQCTDH